MLEGMHPFRPVTPLPAFRPPRTPPSYLYGALDFQPLLRHKDTKTPTLSPTAPQRCIFEGEGGGVRISIFPFDPPRRLPAISFIICTCAMSAAQTLSIPHFTFLYFASPLQSALTRVCGFFFDLRDRVDSRRKPAVQQNGLLFGIIPLTQRAQTDRVPPLQPVGVMAWPYGTSSFRQSFCSWG